MSMLLSHLYLTTAPHSTLVSLGCLERVIRTAAHIIGGIPRTGHVAAYMLDVLHWLPLHHRLIFRLAVLVWRCLLGLAPAYLQELCYPTLGTRGCSSLRSMERGALCPFCPYLTRQAPAFSVVGPLCLEWASIGTVIAPHGSL